MCEDAHHHVIAPLAVNERRLALASLLDKAARAIATYRSRVEREDPQADPMQFHRREGVR